MKRFFFRFPEALIVATYAFVWLLCRNILNIILEIVGSIRLQIIVPAEVFYRIYMADSVSHAQKEINIRSRSRRSQIDKNEMD